MFWLQGATEINYSCCLISQRICARLPPTGDPPKPTGEQGTPTQPPGTGHHHRSWRRAASRTNVSKLTHMGRHKDTYTYMHCDHQAHSTFYPALAKKQPQEGEITGSATKWGFPTGTLHKPATQQRLRVTCWATDIANIRRETDAPQSALKQAYWAPLCKHSHDNITTALELGLTGASIDSDGEGPAVVRRCVLGDRSRKWGEDGEEAMAIQDAVRHGPAVTGLSLPRGKATHWTAQHGAINVRPSHCAVVMADKRLSGSSHRQSSPDTCVAPRYVQSEGKTLTAEAEPGCCEYSDPQKHNSTQTETNLTLKNIWEEQCRHPDISVLRTPPMPKVFINAIYKKLKSGHICLCRIMTCSFGTLSIFLNIFIMVPIWPLSHPTEFIDWVENTHL